jgi:hypothetical protein
LNQREVKRHIITSKPLVYLHSQMNKGRPKKVRGGRTERLVLQLSESEKDLVKTVAKKVNMSIPDMVLSMTQQVIRERKLKIEREQTELF